MKSRKYVSSKLHKNGILLASPELAPHLPSLRTYSWEQLRRMLNRYGMVYVKPDTGSRGIGVIRVELTRGHYSYHQGTRPVRCRSFHELAVHLHAIIGSRRYLIQQGIQVLRRKGRPYDFRVMIQRNTKGSWEPTGTAARMAPPRKAVTNGSQGGTIYAAEDLLRHPAGSQGAKELIQRMDQLARLTAEQISHRYPAMNELGLDIAVDRNLKPWILEVNTRPDPCPFTKLADRTMINRIVAYGKGYGRTYCLKCGKARSAT